MLTRQRRSVRVCARGLVCLLVYFFLAFPVPGEVAQDTSAGNQEKETKNPFAGDSEAVKQGKTFFRLGCAYCHGLDAQGGGRGPDLTSGRWTHGGSDAALLRTIGEGAPGTEMPPSFFNEDENWMIIAFLRSLGGGSQAPVAGDRQAGERIFFEQTDCSLCHMINGKGGRLGPDLSRIGASRSPGNLAESLREPGKEIPNRYETVVVITKDGRRIIGVRKNEDTFSIQLMGNDEELHFFLKSELREITYEPGSLMPAYDERKLGQADLENLVAYLDSLRGQ